VLRGHDRDPGPSALVLRMMGAVNRLALSGSEPQLAALYAAALLPGFLTVAAKTGLPLRLLEARRQRRPQPALGPLPLLG